MKCALLDGKSQISRLQILGTCVLVSKHATIDAPVVGKLLFCPPVEPNAPHVDDSPDKA